MKSFLARRRKAAIIVLAVLILAAGFWYVSANRPPAFGTATVARGNVIASLDEPGTVSVEDNVNLSFQAPGQIAALNVAEGQTVAQGTVLASLDTSALAAAVSQADAAVAQAQAKLDSLMSGTRPELLSIDTTAVATASTSLSASIGTAYAAADDAIHNQTDNLFSNPNSINPTFNVPDANSQRIINIENQRLALGAALAAWYGGMASPTSTTGSLASLAASTLGQVVGYLNAVALSVNGASPNSSISATTLAGYKVNVSTARTEVNAAVTALAAAQAAYENAAGQLALAQAGATPQDIEAQKAAVLQAQAADSAAKVALAHAELVAPFSGTAENLSAKIGQVVSPGVPMLTLINNSGLKVQAYVSEADVAKIKQGQDAVVTLDALGPQETLPATVTTVASAQTQASGVPAYEVDLHFKQLSSDIKDGMTGTVRVIIGEHDNVIEVPSRLVLTENGQSFVLVQNGGAPVQREVQVGLVGNDTTEILSGVNVGDTLVSF